MSRATVIILSPDRQVLAYSLYDGTNDWQTHRLWASQDEAWAKWDTDKRPKCSCKGDPCIVQSTYGGVVEWEGRICRACMVLTEGFGDSPMFPKPSPEWP